jgi:hypothetical protein
MKHFLTIVLLPIAVVVLLAASTATATTQFVRWDIINLTVVNGVPTISSGGMATAIAEDGSKISLTGSGTFVFPSVIGSTVVNGGGTWKTFSPSGEMCPSPKLHPHGIEPVCNIVTSSSHFGRDGDVAVWQITDSEGASRGWSFGEGGGFWDSHSDRRLLSNNQGRIIGNSATAPTKVD